MSMHKIPLTALEHDGLTKHGLPVDGRPSQLTDVFRQGMAWAQAASAFDRADLKMQLAIYKNALDEWFEKTEWVQESAVPKELGLHRADVIKQRFDKFNSASGLKESLTNKNLPRVSKFVVRLSINGVYFDSLPVNLSTAECMEAEIRRERHMPRNTWISVEEAPK